MKTNLKFCFVTVIAIFLLTACNDDRLENNTPSDAKTLEISVATLYRWIPASGKIFTS